MKFKEITIQGSRKVFYNWKLILLFWVTNAILAFVLTLPLYHLLTEQLSHSLISNSFKTHFDFLWLVQFLNIYSISLSEIPFMIVSVVGIYTLVQTFYLGGLISVFNLSQKNHISDFFYGSVKYWKRFFSVLLFTITAFAVLFFISDFLGNLVSLIFPEPASKNIDFIFRLIRYIILLFVIAIITIVSDYTKVSIAVRDENKIVQSIFGAVRFIKKNFILTFSVFLFIAVLGAIGSILYNAFGILIPKTDKYFLILAFVLQQMLVIFRLFIRMFFCSTEVILYKDLNAQTIKIQENSGMEVV